MHNTVNTLAFVMIIWNAAVFVMYGIDKYRAIRGEWRISELTLIISAFLMGGFGALTAMACFRHKTRKLKFRILIPIAAAANCTILWFLKGEWL